MPPSLCNFSRVIPNKKKAIRGCNVCEVKPYLTWIPLIEGKNRLKIPAIIHNMYVCSILISIHRHPTFFVKLYYLFSLLSFFARKLRWNEFNLFSWACGSEGKDRGDIIRIASSNFGGANPKVDHFNKNLQQISPWELKVED